MPFGRKTMAGAVLALVLVGLGVAVATTAGIAAWEYSNSNAFCTNACHAVHPEEPVAHAASSHARVQCVECHMGRVSTLELMLIKPTHMHELWGMIVGYDRPKHSRTMRPARDSCEACHWPEARHADTVRTRVHYGDDKKSQEARTTLVMRTGSGEARQAGSRGIHWHIGQELTYAATDEGKQKIPWVQVKGGDGKVTTWYDPTSGVTPQQIEKLEKRRMDCIDCHNAAGHPFPNPSKMVDQAIFEGRISRDLPEVKARAMRAIGVAAKELHGPAKDRDAELERRLGSAAMKHDKPELAKKEKEFVDELRRILLRTSFAEKGFTWKTFPDNLGHDDFPGCFRCHDGKHLDSGGQAIRLQCTLCHALPQVVREDGARSVVSTVNPDLSPLPSHSEPNFMHEHRSKVDDSCKMCHGKIQWGTEGGSFCSNPACHGRKWPEMNLDAKAAAPPATKPKEGKGT
jgi:nitrate/TMAO reductase-like tetraheme cytochrome c subunit